MASAGKDQEKNGKKGAMYSLMNPLMPQSPAGQTWVTVHPACKQGKKVGRVGIVLTDEPLDAQRLDLHVHQQTAVRLHQCWGQSRCRFGLGQFDDTCYDAVDQTGWGKGGRGGKT